MATAGKRRVAVIGTGHRGAGTWGRELLGNCGNVVDSRGTLRQQYAAPAARPRAVGVDCAISHRPRREARPRAGPIRSSCARPTAPMTTHRQGARGRHDVVTEKPMTTTAAKGRASSKPSAAPAGASTSPSTTATRRPRRASRNCCSRRSSATITSVDFHWYLDTRHGADYFRRWHAYENEFRQPLRPQGDAPFRPAELVSRVRARGGLRPRRARGLRQERPVPRPALPDLPARGRLRLLLRHGQGSLARDALRGAVGEDGYVRDACVFREDIDIPDTMNASILFENGVQASYSLNASMPIEGYHLAFNGTKGRIEIRQYEASPGGAAGRRDPAGPQLRRRSSASGCRTSRAGISAATTACATCSSARHGAIRSASAPVREPARMSLLCGVAAMESADSGGPVKVRLPASPS